MAHGDPGWNGAVIDEICFNGGAFFFPCCERNVKMSAVKWAPLLGDELLTSGGEPLITLDPPNYLFELKRYCQLF